MNKLIRNIILFILPFVIGIMFLFLIPIDKKFNYQFVKGECGNKASWIYSRLYESKENIDIAFIGASHTSCAIMDSDIEKESNKVLGKEFKVANLGYCRSGRDIQYVMLKDLLKVKQPKLLVLEVTEDEPKKSHPVFPYLASSYDLWSSFVLFNQRYFTNILKGVVVRFEFLKHLLFDKGESNLPNTRKHGYNPTKQIVSSEILYENKEVWNRRLSNSKPNFIRNLELNYSKHYLKKMVQLANKNNCKVVFLYLPESGSQLQTPLLMDFYKSLGETIILPDSIINNKRNWHDATHFNDFGALEVSDFILSKIINY